MEKTALPEVIQRVESAQKPSTSPIFNITGDKVALGPLRRDLLPLYQAWNNDLALLVLEEGFGTPSTLDAAERWYEQASKSDSDVIFTLYERATSRPIGRTALHNIDHRNRTADFSIGIGAKDCWGKGYGAEATRLMLDYGFTGLGLHNIQLSVFSFNERAIRVYRRVGFREIGRRREALRSGGHVHDVIYMDCLATEFVSPVLRALLPESETARGTTMAVADSRLEKRETP
jgi:RimJ/RimL family protein N-acetyltransferase